MGDDVNRLKEKTFIIFQPGRRNEPETFHNKSTGYLILNFINYILLVLKIKNTFYLFIHKHDLL